MPVVGHHQAVAFRSRGRLSPRSNLSVPSYFTVRQYRGRPCKPPRCSDPPVNLVAQRVM